jgi:hypothetical protein
MGRRRLSLPETAAGGAIPDPFPPDLQWPFGRLEFLTRDEVRSSAYEIFFIACRSTSAGGRLAVATGDNHEGAKTVAGAKNMVVVSRLKQSLGLRSRKTRSMVGAKPMTSAEIMRRQMGAAEQTDGRLRKTLARCLVGPQVSPCISSFSENKYFIHSQTNLLVVDAQEGGITCASHGAPSTHQDLRVC